MFHQTPSPRLAALLADKQPRHTAVTSTPTTERKSDAARLSSLLDRYSNVYVVDTYKVLSLTVAKARLHLVPPSDHEDADVEENSTNGSRLDGALWMCGRRRSLQAAKDLLKQQQQQQRPAGGQAEGMAGPTPMRLTIEGLVPFLETYFPETYCETIGVRQPTRCASGGPYGLLFANEDQLPVIQKFFNQFRQPRYLAAGDAAPEDIFCPLGNSGLCPSKTQFFAMRNISTKICRGQIEVLSAPSAVLTRGEIVTQEMAQFLRNLRIKLLSPAVRLHAALLSLSTNEANAMSRSEASVSSGGKLSQTTTGLELPPLEVAALSSSGIIEDALLKAIQDLDMAAVGCGLPISEVSLSMLLQNGVRDMLALSTSVPLNPAMEASQAVWPWGKMSATSCRRLTKDDKIRLNAETLVLHTQLMRQYQFSEPEVEELAPCMMMAMTRKPPTPSSTISSDISLSDDIFGLFAD